MYFIHLSKEDGEISLPEWKELLGKDSSMKYTNTTTYTSPSGELITRSGKHFGEYTYSDTNTPIYFWLEDGVISAVFDSVTLEKIHEMSKKLNGIVYGDLGEEL